MSTIIYGKSNCPYTNNARKAYPDAEYCDVINNPQQLEEMLKLSGRKRQVPVIVEDGKVTIGFNGT